MSEEIWSSFYRGQSLCARISTQFVPRFSSSLESSLSFLSLSLSLSSLYLSSLSLSSLSLSHAHTVEEADFLDDAAGTTATHTQSHTHPLTQSQEGEQNDVGLDNSIKQV